MYDIYAVSDIHGDVGIITKWIEEQLRNNAKAILFVLGDAGINYDLDERDIFLKEKIQIAIDKSAAEKATEIKVLVVRGNHDARPEDCGYSEQNMFKGKIFVQQTYKDLLFLKDGETYVIDDMSYFVAGGGFSEDFHNRLLSGDKLFANQEFSINEAQMIASAAEKAARENEKIIMLTHVMPDKILSRIGIRPEREQKSITENTLQCICEKMGSKILVWWCGHYHVRKDIAVCDKEGSIKFQILNNTVEKMHIH